MNGGQDCPVWVRDRIGEIEAAAGYELERAERGTVALVVVKRRLPATIRVKAAFDVIAELQRRGSPNADVVAKAWKGRAGMLVMVVAWSAERAEPGGSTVMNFDAPKPTPAYEPRGRRYRKQRRRRRSAGRRRWAD